MSLHSTQAFCAALLALLRLSPGHAFEFFRTQFAVGIQIDLIEMAGQHLGHAIFQLLPTQATTVVPIGGAKTRLMLGFTRLRRGLSRNQATQDQQQAVTKSARHGPDIILAAMDISLKIQGLCKRYRKAPSAALDAVSLSVESGQIFGLIGPNGAGKSTLVRCLLGLEKPDAGQITVAGLDLKQDLQAIRRLCGLAPQDPGYYPRLSVEENLQVFGRAWGLRAQALNAAVDQALNATHLQEHRRQLAEHLSGGQRQRMNLSMALLNAPKILILDEPTAGVDAQSRRFMLEMLQSQRDQGTTIIYTSHYLTEIEQLCDKLAIINRGCVLFEGSLQQLRALHPARLMLRFAQLPDDSLLEALGAHASDMVLDGRQAWLETTQPLECLSWLQQQSIETEAIHYGPESLEAIYFSEIEAQDAEQAA